ncbi:DUF402 domain-containing protein [Jidongwangia harbinensis]|uniref:DUF402 domain-containing protein n=1 Tax=Jidongwangia harbinensis TaxID=2878561 RepID=UPI001CDA0485|nr:DUF402 domain-containing protein [Jidongwangia harbinensis]MCA2214384.1 DUF402 domain-containing protein [Jidongwangia harbinensis]
MGVEIRFTKWGGRPHWRYTLEPFATDRHGWWLGGRAGILLQRGSEPPVVQPSDVVLLVPPGEPWIASWNDPAANDIALYVDVTTTPVRDGDAVHAVDLDLDVVRWRDGRVDVLDEDEFADHQVRYGYPPEIVTQALETTGDLVARITAGTEPFGAAGAARLAEFSRPA